jgi:hypothetical protein
VSQGLVAAVEVDQMEGVSPSSSHQNSHRTVLVILQRLHASNMNFPAGVQNERFSGQHHWVHPRWSCEPDMVWCRCAGGGSPALYSCVVYVLGSDS